MKSEKLLPQVRVLYRPTSVCLPAVSSPSGRHPLVIENVERVGNDLHTVEVHSAYHITHVMVPFWYAFASYNPRMNVHSGKHLSTELRKACDSVEHRLWIASPYIGAWKSVRRILGKSWWDKEVDVKLLSDEEANPNGDTLRRFAQRGLIYHLRGLHAKIYIIDNKVLLTSANLTRTAFSCRYESGIFLAGRRRSLRSIFMRVGYSPTLPALLTPLHSTIFLVETVVKAVRTGRVHSPNSHRFRLTPAILVATSWSIYFWNIEDFRRSMTP